MTGAPAEILSANEDYVKIGGVTVEVRSQTLACFSRFTIAIRLDSIIRWWIVEDVSTRYPEFSMPPMEETSASNTVFD